MYVDGTLFTLFCFFKQKTAYDMRISDWSSDVCSSDLRSAFSPWWSIQNIQLSMPLGKRMEVYGGLKNLLNWKPGNGEPFLIARSHDPFDHQVRFDEQCQAMVTPENPYGLTFDPAYVFGPNQGLRGFLGLRIILDRKSTRLNSSH